MPSKGISKLETSSIGKLMAELCVQATFSVMLYNIYIITDTLFVSKGVGSTASGAIGVFSPVLVFVGGISSTLGVGSGSIISRRLGEKDLKGGKTVIGCMVWIWCLCALVITAIGLLFLNPLLSLLGCTVEIYPYAAEYGRIMLLGTICSTGFSGVMRAGGDTLYSTLQWCCPVLINMALDPVLIYGFQMGITGAALATVCAQMFSLLCSIYYFFKNKEDIFQSLVLSLFHQCNYLIGEHFHDESPAFRYAALCQVEFEAVRMNELVRETYYEGYTSPVIFEKITNHLTEMTIQIFGDSLTLSREDIFLRSLLIKGAMRSYVIQFGFSTSVDAGRYSEICLRTALELLGVDCDETDAVLERLRERLPEIRDIANTMIHQQ